MKNYIIITKDFSCKISVKNMKIKNAEPALHAYVDQDINTLFNWLESTYEEYQVKVDQPETEELDAI